MGTLPLGLLLGPPALGAIWVGRCEQQPDGGESTHRIFTRCEPPKPPLPHEQRFPPANLILESRVAASPAKRTALQKHALSVAKLSPMMVAGAWQMSAALALPELWWLRWVA